MKIPLTDGGSILGAYIEVTVYGNYVSEDLANKIAIKIEGGIVRQNNRTKKWTVFYPSPKTDLANKF